jgi:peptide-methionine (S)-S-oxide reductase
MRYLLLILSIITYPLHAKTEEALFAGGCFWSVESDFDKVPGVLRTISGYDGGTSINPNYELVSSGKTQYVETVLVTYDPDIVTYEQLLTYYWHHIDPMAKDAQFCDHGPQYRTVIFYLNEAQKKAAINSKLALKNQFPVIYTDIRPSTHFYEAEEYHQNYYLKNPIHYKLYRSQCGRDKRISEVWHEKTH